MDFILKIFFKTMFANFKDFCTYILFVARKQKTNEIPNDKHDIFPSSIISFLFALR